MTPAAGSWWAGGRGQGAGGRGRGGSFSSPPLPRKLARRLYIRRSEEMEVKYVKFMDLNHG